MKKKARKSEIQLLEDRKRLVKGVKMRAKEKQRWVEFKIQKRPTGR